MKVKTVIIGVVVLALAGGGVYGTYKVKGIISGYEKDIVKKGTEINELQTRINYVGELKTVYELSADGKSGTEILAENLVEAQVPAKIADECVTDLTEIVGKYYLLDCPTGTMLTKNMLLDFIVTNDMRYLDIVFDEVPIGLAVGDYLDVRVSFTMGQDFVGITHKRVVNITDNVVKLIVDQKDFYVYESMKVDKVMYSGTKIYGVQYVEAGVQLAASDYYPVSLNVLATIIQDPNIKTDYSSLTIVDRTALETTLIANTESTKEILRNIENGKTALSEIFKTSKLAYDSAVVEQQQADAKQAELDAAIESGEAAPSGEVLN